MRSNYSGRRVRGTGKEVLGCYRSYLTSFTMEPELEKVVWNTGLDSAPLYGVPMELKLGSLVILFLLTVISGLVSLFVCRRQWSASSSGPHHRMISLSSCFAGGIFLSTCLLDMMPGYLSAINDALRELNITLQFPLQEFIMAMGFFLVLVMEQISLGYKEQSAPSEEKNALLGSHDHTALPHVQMDVNAQLALRTMVLVLSLSLHSALEGVALGLQQGTMLKNSLVLLVHKSILSFSLIVKLGQGRLHTRALLVCILLYSAMSPLGITIGLAVSGIGDPVHKVTCSVLDGIIVGTFTYITFLEILPRDLSTNHQRIPRVIVLLCGFTTISAILFLKI
ncbi:hypothetical protein GDO86_019612 [Hymenochirus boettgeri]|uniref:Solute carrier family 39 member 1 n=1 Tax=Hymenochirus boettgeri TaxID=247094 RepID=A0A8T2IIK0_9PIPI|nr:hypothetical protein GDO86_019612 [Hymenochirus boettgeri]